MIVELLRYYTSEQTGLGSIPGWPIWDEEKASSFAVMQKIFKCLCTKYVWESC